MTPSTAQMLRTEPTTTTTLMTAVLTSTVLARIVIVGMPLLSLLAAIMADVTWLAVLLAAGFIGTAAIVCRRALLTFTGDTLRLLVAARVVIVVVLAAVLFTTSGMAHAAIVSAVLCWLVGDRLVGRHALYDLWKLVKPVGTDTLTQGGEHGRDCVEANSEEPAARDLGGSLDRTRRPRPGRRGSTS